MVILFSGRNCAAEKQLIEILSAHGANYISDKQVLQSGGDFTVISEYKKTDIRLQSGVAVLIDDTDRFAEQRFPGGMIGICEDTNRRALEIFQKSGLPVITCGMNAKSTITFSSMGEHSLLVALQRGLTDRNGKQLYPEEFRVSLKKQYHPFAVMAALAILLVNGIRPKEF